MSAWSNARQREFVHALEEWFEKNARAMSWRETQDPYAIWVSEVMLQQTRVETVERYFLPFLERFPDLSTLAASSEDDVMAAWSGLGYYRRARMLHRGAKELCEQGAKALPDTAQALQAIHGIGPYTAGAVACIAFNRPEALVDGNVARVSSRLQGIETPKQQLATAKIHWEWVHTLMQLATPRTFAQALMELGATTCVPKNPRCEDCPVQGFCQAKAQGRQAQIPAPKVKTPVLDLHYRAVFFFDTRGRILLQKRPAKGLLSDMWCLPLVEESVPPKRRSPKNPRPKALQLSKQSTATSPPGATAGITAAQLRQKLPELLPPSLQATKIWGPAELWQDFGVEHIFSHRRWILRGASFSAQQAPPTSLGPRYRWCTLSAAEISQLGSKLGGGVPSVTKKLLRAVLEYRKQPRLFRALKTQKSPTRSAN